MILLVNLLIFAGSRPAARAETIRGATVFCE